MRLDAPEEQALGAQLMVVLGDASEAWPEFDLPAGEFVAFLAERVSGEGAIDKQLQSLHCSDLYLTCACSKGDAAAIEAFDAQHGTTMAIALSAMKNLGSIEDEVRQRLHEKLFVGSASSPPRIVTYFGSGALRSWVRAATVREAISLARKGNREILGKDEYIASLPALEDDPEMMHLKGLYRKVFKSAFEQAFSQLSARDRTLLRYKYCDGSTLDDVATLYRVHRATAARWFAQIREQLFSKTRELMKAELATSESELDSIMRVIQSKLDVSIADQLEG